MTSSGGQGHLRSPRVGVAAALTAAAAYAVLAGVWTPRGPNDAVEAVTAMVLGWAVGALAGAATRRRWPMIVAPLVFIGVFELVRLSASGATVDVITLSSTYGILAFVVGRMFHGVLALLPMVVGVAVGRRFARRDQEPRPVGRSRAVAGALGRAGLWTVSSLLLVLLVALVRPATTAPILGADGETLAGSIAEFATVELDGHDQTMLIRGHDRHDPVVLFLAGGPGGSEVGTMSRRAGPLERDFVVVTWDQLGTGRSTGQFDPAATLSVEAAVADTIAVSQYLRARFDQDRIYLVGNSYGTILGVRAAERRPDLYAAVVGAGQMVDVVETDRMFYEDTLLHAATTADGELTATLLANGEPPYDDLLDMSPLVEGEHRWNDYSGIPGFPGRQEPTDHLLVSEYTLMDQVRSMANLLDTYVTLYPDLYDVDLRDTTRLDVPVYLVQGAHEARGRATLADAWFESLAAPDKVRVDLSRSGHRPFAQEPEAFARVMTGTVLARTQPLAGIDGAPAGAADDATRLADLFARYNPAVWPAQLVAYALGVTVLWLVARRPGRRTDRLASGVLATGWAWLGLVFLGRHAAQDDPLLAAAYGAMFLWQGWLLARSGVVRDRLRFTPGAGLAGRVGWILIGYAVVVYPLVGVLLGHGYPESPLFGSAPCPTTIATFGLLLLAGSGLPRHLLVVPTVWAVLAPLAAVGHGYVEDLGLVVAAIATVWLTFRRPRPRGPGSHDDHRDHHPHADDHDRHAARDGHKAQDPDSRDVRDAGHVRHVRHARDHQRTGAPR